jgi:hypothetical protein
MGYYHSECATCYQEGRGNIRLAKTYLICGFCIIKLIGKDQSNVHWEIRNYGEMGYEDGGYRCDFCNKRTALYTHVSFCDEDYEKAITSPQK